MQALKNVTLYGNVNYLGAVSDYRHALISHLIHILLSSLNAARSLECMHDCSYDLHLTDKSYFNPLDKISK